LGTNAFGSGFEEFYAKSDRQAGVYKVNSFSGGWTYRSMEQAQVDAEKAAEWERFFNTPFGQVLKYLGMGVLMAGTIWMIILLWPAD